MSNIRLIPYPRMPYSNLLTSTNITAAKLAKADTGITDKTRESSGYIITHGHQDLILVLSNSLHFALYSLEICRVSLHGLRRFNVRFLGVYYTNVCESWVAILSKNKCTRDITVTILDTHNISIGQSSKMATWPPLQHDWSWPIAIYWAIDTRERSWSSVVCYSTCNT